VTKPVADSIARGRRRRNRRGSHGGLDEQDDAMSSVERMAASSPDRDLDAARRVLQLEAQGLTALGAVLGQELGRLIELLAGVSGRVIVSGIGKSGHIACKIAATLSSTGTPAQFVHPAEASHGDLGMITDQDAVLALSNSGRTAELSDLIVYTRRFGIPLIAITSGESSQLHEQADVAIILPPVGEACPLGLAPTTSTTMMLALGDAIAVALLERKGFSASDYQVLHPGGALGRRLLRVADVMHGPQELPLCDRATPLAEAILVMTNKTFGCIGVVDDDGRLLGIITDGDLRRHMAPNLLDQPAGQVMTPGPRTIGDQALAAEALRIMNERSITSLFVIDDGRPTGIVRMHDCLRAGIA